MKKLVENLGLVLVICVGLRLGAALVEPVLPLLSGLAAVTLLAIWIKGRNGPGGGYR